MRMFSLLAGVLALGLWAGEPAKEAPKIDKDAPGGLVGEYFDTGEAWNDFQKLPADAKPFYVRVDRKIDFASTEDEFYDTKLADNFYVRWTGILRIEKAGEHVFYLNSDDGSRMTIDGKLVVNNGGIHGMQEKEGKVELAAGDHEILIEMFEGGVGAGIIADWLPPGGKKERIPPKVFFHKKGTSLAFDRERWEKNIRPPRKPNRYEIMDYGPFHIGSIESGYPHSGNVANKGIAIKFGDKKAGFCFDMELLRMHCCWVDGYLRMPTGRDGIEGHPFNDGVAWAGTKAASPGWFIGDKGADPRPKPYGPLPENWGRYKGLYVNGENVVLKYTVGGAEILELPGYQEKSEVGLFTRTFSIKNASEDMVLVIAEKDESTGGVGKLDELGSAKSAAAKDSLAWLKHRDYIVAVAATNAPKESVLEVFGPRVQLKLNKKGNVDLTIAIHAGNDASVAKFASAVRGLGKGAKPKDFTKAGASRWPETFTLSGTLGAENDAYTVDTIPIPFENPWEAYMRLTAVDFFKDGRAAVATMSGDVWIVSGIDAKLDKVTWKRFAAGLFQPLGLKVVNDVIYTLGRDQITRLIDSNKDGEADYYENFNNECHVSPGYHEFAHDLMVDKAGNFYYAKGSELGAGATIHNGTLLRVSKDGKKLDIYAKGFRAPNGLGISPDGVLTSSDNQGNWTPSCPVNWIKEGSFQGYQLDNTHPETKTTPRAHPIVWIPYVTDNSGGGQVFVEGGKWGPLDGELLHMSYGKCHLFLVLKEFVGETPQGAVYKFPLDFASGIMRARVHPKDGQVYLAGMKGWQTSAAKDGCFQRVRYTGKPAYIPHKIHYKKGAVEIGFTCELNKADAEDVENYSAEWFNIERTGAYGSPEFSVADPKKKARDEVEVKAAKLSADGKTVTLEIPTLKPVNSLVLKYKIKAKDGKELSQQLDCTVNVIP